MFYTVEQVMEILSTSKATAYRTIKKLNGELEEKGYMTLSGKVNATYLKERFGLIQGE